MARYEDLVVQNLTINGDIKQHTKQQGIAKIKGSPNIQNWYEISGSQKYPLGTPMQIYDRVFHYAQAGAVALVRGNLLQSAANAGATTTLQKELTIATASTAGQYFGYATNDTTAQAANLYQDGWYMVTKGSAAQGFGGMYRIRSHAAFSGSTKFYFYDPVVVAISTSAEATLVTNQYKAVIQAPATTATGTVVGVAPVAVTASYYFWCQTGGPACVLCSDDASAAGETVIRNLGTAGSVKPMPAIDVASTGTTPDEEIVGTTLYANTAGEGTYVFLTIAS